MAGFGDIPMVQPKEFHPSEILERIMQQRREEQFDPFRMALMKAQTDQAAESAKLTPARMELMRQQAEKMGAWTNLLNMVTGKPSSSPTNQSGLSSNDANNIANMHPGDAYVVGSSGMPTGANGMSPQSRQSTVGIDPRNADLLAGLLRMPVQQTTIDGKLVRSNPFSGTNIQQIGQTPEQKSAMELKLARDKAIAEGDIKLAQQYDQQGMASNATTSTLNDLMDLVKSPTWLGMRKFSGLTGKYDLEYYKRNGTPEEQKLAGSFAPMSGQIIADMASIFKGQFRRGEQTLITGMKPNEGDTPFVAQGKIERLLKMNQFMNNRAELMSKFIRNGIPPNEALNIADRQLKGDLFRKTLSENPSLKKSMQSSGLNTNNMASPNTVNKSHINEENIAYTMKQTGLSREEVMARLKKKGLL